MNSAVTPLYFEPEREQETCWQPEVFYSYTQKEEHSLENFPFSHGGARNDNLAKWMFFGGLKKV